MVKIPQITTSNDEVSLSRHPRRQCNTLWPRVKWMRVNFHSNIHIRVIAIFCKSSEVVRAHHTYSTCCMLFPYLNGWRVCLTIFFSKHKKKMFDFSCT